MGIPGFSSIAELVSSKFKSGSCADVVISQNADRVVSWIPNYRMQRLVFSFIGVSSVCQHLEPNGSGNDGPERELKTSKIL